MKHNYFKHLFAVLLLLCSTVAMAHDFEVDGIYYNIINESDKTVEVAFKGDGYDSYSDEYTGTVSIPESVTYNGTTYSVTSIGELAFTDCTGLTSIEIPNSVTTIGESAFRGCTGLTSIEIPNSVTNIGNCAFYGCTGLASITIPNSVTSIEYGAFCDCTGLTSITIPNSVTSIGEWAFSGCTGLTSIIIEEGNSKYDSRNNCNAIIETGSNMLIAGCKNTIIPNSVTTIGSSAFSGCTGLTSITIPNSVTSIGSDAFYDCTGLTRVTIGNGVTTIGYQAFYGCTGLTSIEIPNSVTSIGDYAFWNCTGLTSITIPNSVTSIGEGAFYGCSDLETIYISNSIESIGDYAFADCNSIIEIKAGSKQAITANENIFSSDAYNNAVLYVPTSRKFAYEKATPWSNFYILEMDFTSVEEITDNRVQSTDIYNLQGHKVENPTKGIYIINGKKVLVK